MQAYGKVCITQTVLFMRFICGFHVSVLSTTACVMQ